MRRNWSYLKPWFLNHKRIRKNNYRIFFVKICQLKIGREWVGWGMKVTLSLNGDPKNKPTEKAKWIEHFVFQNCFFIGLKHMHMYTYVNILYIYIIHIYYTYIYYTYSFQLLQLIAYIKNHSNNLNLLWIFYTKERENQSPGWVLGNRDLGNMSFQVNSSFFQLSLVHMHCTAEEKQGLLSFCTEHKLTLRNASHSLSASTPFLR